MSEETPEYRMKLAGQLWESLELRSVVYISHVNAMLAVRVQNKQPFTVEETLDDIKMRNMSPNRDTFQQILDNYSLAGDLNGVERTLEIMKARRIMFNTKIYNSLILAYGFGG